MFRPAPIWPSLGGRPRVFIERLLFWLPLLDSNQGCRGQGPESYLARRRGRIDRPRLSPPPYRFFQPLSKSGSKVLYSCSVCQTTEAGAAHLLPLQSSRRMSVLLHGCVSMLTRHTGAPNGDFTLPKPQISGAGGGRGSQVGQRCPRFTSGPVVLSQPNARGGEIAASPF